MDKHRILIADDSEINRIIIKEMLKDEYEILEASDGWEVISCIQNFYEDIDLLLLDINMPNMDGITVLEMMNKNGWIKDIPVIVISTETSTAFTKKAFALGVDDFIARPFDANIVAHRIKNAMMLHANQKQLIDEVTQQFYIREHQNDMMVSILSQIVEYRNGESGAHVLHINMITGMLLERLRNVDKTFQFSNEDIENIKNASSFHDIGKLGIPSEILNKPGRLTEQEFTIMKKHSAIGKDMMDGVSLYQNESLVKYAKEICNWHHERWDGKGYPDGLKEKEIPIAAQVVSLADVYDALTSKRCYKEAFSHEKAMQMIQNGECGAFNPLLLQCLKDIENDLKLISESKIDGEVLEEKMMDKLLNDLKIKNNINVSRNVRLAREIRERQNTFVNLTSEIWFEYYDDPPKITFNKAAIEYFKLPYQIFDPLHSQILMDAVGEEALTKIANKIENSMSSKSLYFSCELKEFSLVGRTLWATQDDGTSKISSMIARVFISDKS